MKFSVRDFFSKYDQILKKLQMWPHLMKKSIMKILIFCEMKHLAIYMIKKWFRV